MPNYPEPPTWDPFPDPYPGLTLPRYGGYNKQYPYSDMPLYSQYGQAFPSLDMPVYEQFGQEYPTLGEMFDVSGDVIQKMLKGEITELPVEELMSAYTAEEQRALEEYFPKLREYWSSKEMLRSGMAQKAERGALAESAERRATYKAGLEKESAIRQQEGIITGLNLAMQYTGIEYGAQSDAWNAAQGEYVRVYQSLVNKGLSEYQADAQAWDAGMNEFTKVFQSKVQQTAFAQGIKEKAYSAARDEYYKVYQADLQAGMSEYQAKEHAWQAGYQVYNDNANRELQTWMTEYEAELRRELELAGYEASKASSIVTIIGSIIIALLPFIL